LFEPCSGSSTVRGVGVSHTVRGVGGGFQLDVGRSNQRPTGHREARRRAALFRERAKAIVVEIAKPRTRDAERLQ